MPYLVDLYGHEIGRATLPLLLALMQRYTPRLGRAHARASGLSERDSLLVTYGDQILAPRVPPLPVLAAFCRQRQAGLVCGLHILPFYPSTSENDFAVRDYHAVDPTLGDWDDVARLGQDFLNLASIFRLPNGSQTIGDLVRGRPF